MKLNPTLPQYETYLRDESRLCGRADWIVFPVDTAELVNVLVEAAKRSLRITVQGGHTGIVGGSVPQEGMIVNLTQMNRLLGLRKKDNTFFLRVQAGVTLQQLEDFFAHPIILENWQEEDASALALLKSGPKYCFAPNPTEKTATIGGLYACNARGPNALRYGSVAEYIEGLLWITPAGEYWEIQRGNYVFNESGCLLPNGEWLNCNTHLPHSPMSTLSPRSGTDLVDFLAASEGELGVAAELELRLVIQPVDAWGVVYFFDTDAKLHSFAESIIRWKRDYAGNILNAVEYYDEAVLNLIRDKKSTVMSLKDIPDLPLNANAALYIELCGIDAKALESALLEHLELFGEVGGNEEDTWAGSGAAEMQKFQVLRHCVPELVNTEVDTLRLHLPSLTKMSTDFMASPSKATQYCAFYHDDIAKAGVRGYVFGHLIENHLHVNLLPETQSQFEICKELVHIWAQQVIQDGGRLVTENGVGKLKRSMLCEFLSEEHIHQFTAIKKTFDPCNRLGGSFQIQQENS